MKKKTVHIISHSHWDREWYLPFEQHRIRLLDLMDNAMELFEQDKGYKGFHLDGQTIVLDDYLEIKPQNRAKIETYIQNGKFTAGPWYVLQDEFFTSEESNIRNLMTGMRDAAKYGKICRIGYFPDAFGNAGQMPQILKQAGMEAIVFGRGVKAVGADNRTECMDMETTGAYESLYSEMNWEAPDGSSLPGILFANWYNNAMEIPVEEEAAKQYWDEVLKKAEAYAGTKQLLMMNGCDHQPVQQNLTEAIAAARRLYPDIEFIHSDLETYVQAVKKELQEEKKELSTVSGELTSQETDGLWTLVNTSSSWVNLKQMNRRCETALEKEAEPMAAIAAVYGKTYPKELLVYSWKTLMQNHPHDSICGCSIDEVNAEMQIRFAKSHQVAEEISKESMKFLADKIDTRSWMEKNGDAVIPFAVFNTTGWKRSGIVTVELDYQKRYGTALEKQYDEMAELILPELCLKDSTGKMIAAKIEDAGVGFGYDLPNDRFRQPFMARKIRVTFEAEEVPAMGYRTYQLCRAEKQKCPDHTICEVNAKAADHVMENDFLHVTIHEDGSYTLTEKKTGKQYQQIGYFEETGDIGNEYIYIQDKDGLTFTTKGTQAEITLLEEQEYQTVYEIRHKIMIPEEADEEAKLLRRKAADIHGRLAGRSAKYVPLSISTKLILERHGKGLKAETTIKNTAKDHRIRVMIPTGLKTDEHRADSVFEIAVRKNKHGRNWKNPCECEHQQKFTAMSDGENGILAANFGLYEYEILPDQENTIAVTLLRATAELGDWGVFPTPNAQMQGTYTMKYEIIPFAEDAFYEACVEAYQFQTEFKVCQLNIQKGELPKETSFLNWKGKGLNLTGLKMREGIEAEQKMPDSPKELIVRWSNMMSETSELIVDCSKFGKEVYRSNVIEERKECLEVENGIVRLSVRPHEILTLGIVLKEV